jgi:hypothetical protein
MKRIRRHSEKERGEAGRELTRVNESGEREQASEREAMTRKRIPLSHFAWPACSSDNIF